ncbi:flagellar hook-length control protein FliK [Paracoccus limosus]|uniref:flagellar hook-length control protein FliK n=1 Tax=Paracoccus limosus TaxID=913252 RepID=UPI0014783F28
MTDPGISVVINSPAAPSRDGADFEASLTEEPTDASDEDEDKTELAEEAVPVDVVPLEQFVRKQDAILGALTVAGPALAEPAQAGATVPQSPPVAEAGVAPGADAAPRPAHPLPRGEMFAAAEPTDRIAEPSQNHADEVAPEPDRIPDLPSPPTKDAKPEVTSQLLSAEVTVHQAREARPEPAMPHVVAPRHGTAEAREISRQIARQMHANQDRIEITLTPEELGRVRLVMTPGEAPSVMVYADNQQTLDLLRRNADMLMRELSDTGFGGASLSFGEGGERGGFAYQQATTRDGPGDSPARDMTTQPRPVSDRRLDIRI